MFLLQSCYQAVSVLSKSFEDTAILTGVSDTIIVKHLDGSYRSSPFLVSFGPFQSAYSESDITLLVNSKPVDVKFKLDHKGYAYPKHLSDKEIRKLGLAFGMNKVTYSLEEISIDAEIYLYADSDKLVVSDVDGTATKSDIGGHIHNFMMKDFMHPGYVELMHRLT
jgi:phosphatidate phosphatase PAH1